MKQKMLALILIFVLALGTFAACGSNDADDGIADTVIIGMIYTADGEGTVAQAAAIKDGIYVYVGDEENVQPFIGDDTEVITLEGGMVLPSFMDAHAHGSEGGVGYLFEVNLYEATSMEEYITIITDFVAEHPELDVIRGAGWINGYCPEGGPTAAVLDEISSDIPIVLISGDHHSEWVNSKAMEMAGIDKNTPDVVGGVIERDANGNPTGTFRETAGSLIDEVVPEYTVEQYKAGILAYQDEAKTFGITSYFEPFVQSNLLTAYNELDEAGELELRVFGGYGISAEGDPLAEVDKIQEYKEASAGGMFEMTTIKMLVDGVVEGHTAYLLEGYADNLDDTGKQLFEQDVLNEICAKADKMGIQLHAHCIGDAAVKQAVDAYEYAAEQNGSTENRHAITHLQIVDPADILRMAELNIIASTNPYWFCKEPGYFYELEVPFLGEERANKEYPMKSFFDAGVVVTAAGDFPVTMPAMPLAAIQTGVTRCDRYGDPETLQNPTERVTVEQMIQASTLNGAYENFAEDLFGSIQIGKSADLLILDQNILEIDPVTIGETNILKVLMMGKSIYSME